jgi:hypothetical protein
MEAVSFGPFYNRLRRVSGSSAAGGKTSRPKGTASINN